MKKAAVCLLLILFSTSVICAEVTRKKIRGPDGTKEHVFYSGEKEVARQIVDKNGNIIKITGKIPDGVVKGYYDNGALSGMWSYKNDKKEGVVKEYYKDGKLLEESNYKNGRLEGTAKLYYKNGKVADVFTYKNGQLINRKTYDMKGILRLERDFPVEKKVGR